MTVTTFGCKKLWQSAQARRPEPYEGRHKCLTCPIGAGHAGVSLPEQSAKRAADCLRSICARCQSPTERGDRRQALVNGLLCVSCDNRQREVDRNRNSKGSVPRLASILHSRTVLANGVPVTFARVVDCVEAIVLATKAGGSGRVAIARPPAPVWVFPEGYTEEPGL